MLKEKTILHISEINQKIKNIENASAEMNRSNTYTPYHDHMQKILVSFGVEVFKQHHQGITERFFDNRKN